jgi:hypothetical protein
MIARDPDAMPFAVTGGSPDGDVIQVRILSASITQARTVVLHYYSPADYDQDGDVDLADFEVLIRSWLKQPDDAGYDARADLDKDSSGKVNLHDCAVFLGEWTDEL